MSGTAPSVDNPLRPSGASIKALRLEETLRAAGPALLFGLRLWISVSMALYAAFWLQLDDPFWAGASAAIVCQPQLGSSLRKGWFRMLGTIIGVTMSIVLTACFAQDRGLFLAGLALWCAACAFVATLLRNFASYAASLAGYTVAIIASDLLGAVGGVDANAAFLLAVSRGTEICLGIACAGVVLAATDLGGSRRRLAALFADLARGITHGLTATLTTEGPEVQATRPVRRESLRQVIALDPIIDQALGESAEVRYHSPVLQRSVDGLFSALAGWQAVADHLAALPDNDARCEAATILEHVPQELQLRPQPGSAASWIGDPAASRRLYRSAERRLIELHVAVPSLRLLADKTAQVFGGIAHTLSGVALLLGEPAQAGPRHGWKGLLVPDWMPPLVSAGRTFAVISAVALFWIVTGWPDGALAVTFAAIVALLLAPRSDETYGAALLFAVGAIADLILTAIVTFAVLPWLATDDFAAFTLVMGVCVIPIGTLLRQARQPWQVGLLTAMTMGFVPILQPTNPETYDAQVFYNVALTIVAGMGAAAMSFRLLPPLSPTVRARRLLALTLRDLRRLATGRSRSDWERHTIVRLSALPNEATPQQRAQLLAALAVGSEIILLRRQAGIDLALNSAFGALAGGQSAIATTRLSDLDVMLRDVAEGKRGTQDLLRVRASIAVLSEALTKHATYFDGGSPP